jgi:hypothetical protein
MDSGRVLSVLSSYFIGVKKLDSRSSFTCFELRKALIRLRACNKALYNTQFYKVYNLKFDFSDYKKIETFVKKEYTDNWYKNLKLMRSFVIPSRYQDLSFDVDKWTLTQWRLHQTISLYGIVKYKKWCWVGQCAWINNKPFENSFKAIEDYTPENIYNAMKLMTLDELMSMGL